ncbi:hypothetical protein BU24DRAFT_407864 [Aaosphaeria arxii CBS 175.79]|uniref:Alpha/beta-hydrolase n=1 Tax=Aaosphaeria arxii CBS 175.79 TaxID=1450172 RepID=A0A6A5XX40_9PLEO|nr:uncharacterized protein BU24DRAFT_407864 [Aaosphaeria arxii CBS 175.79]KAF2017898.1 hypothetical protein BU24DRAFT_407864 [Aaosphaeria arxii CBS 175.79]
MKMKIGAVALALVAIVLGYDHGPSYYFEVETLANHTLYQPLESALGSKLKLPIVVWGNGGCAPGMSENKIPGFPLMNIHSRSPIPRVAHDPNSPASNQNPGALTAAIDWVYANAGKGQWKHIDASRIGVWGTSCGGLESYTAGVDDSRVGHIGIFNSGQLNETASKAVAGAVRKPIFYLLGGPDDVAYPNGERDYTNLPSNTPAWKANHALGHSAAFDAPNGGIPAIVGTHIMKWLLRGDVTARKWFTSEAPKKIGITDITYQNLDRVKVTPNQKH